MGRVLDQEGGLGVYARCLVPELLSQDPHTRYVIFLNTEKSRDLLRRFPNAEPHVLPGRNKLYWDQVSVALAARKLGVDLIFNPKFSIPLLSGRPCVFVQQGSDWYVNPQNYEWWDNLYMRVMLPLFSRKARRTLAISQATLDDLAKYAHIDVSHSVVTYAGVAHNITAERDPQALAGFRAKYQLPERFILTVSRAYHSAQRRLIPYPGGNDETLLRAYRRYRAHGGELPLVVVGFRIKEYLCERGFSERDLADVHFLGLVPNTEMHLAYQSAECFVLASALRELRNQDSGGARHRVPGHRADDLRQPRDRRERGPTGQSPRREGHRPGPGRGDRLGGAAPVHAGERAGSGPGR